MELRFVPPELRRLDEAGTEVIVCGLFSDERPPHGALGLVDWRLAGGISHLIQKGWVTGREGESVMVPVRPKLPFDKAVLFGFGERGAFNELTCRRLTEQMLRVMERLCARNAVVELPGRHVDAIAPEQAADILLELAGGRPEHDVWTLIERSDDQKRITARMVEQRRRVRRVALG